MALPHPHCSPGGRALVPHRGAAPPATYTAFVPHSPIYREALARLERYARYDDTTVLVEGESGTGKTYFARRLHEASPRARGPFQHVNLASLDDSLAGSDLFGHVAGAFTGANQHRRGVFSSAEGGTLFLDEIGQASRALQCKLLHAIEYGEVRPLGSDRAVRVNARIVAATNVPLPALVDGGRFLPDLLARVNGFRIVIPPLRERPEDIPRLVTHLVATYAPQHGYASGSPAVDRELMTALARAPWPYNVRQLDATIRRLLIDADGAPVITHALYNGDGEYPASAGDQCTPKTVEQAISESGSKAAAARRLGVSRSTVYRRMKHDGDGAASGRAKHT